MLTNPNGSLLFKVSIHILSTSTTADDGVVNLKHYLVVILLMRDLYTLSQTTQPKLIGLLLQYMWFYKYILYNLHYVIGLSKTFLVG